MSTGDHTDTILATEPKTVGKTLTLSMATLLTSVFTL